MGHTRIGVRLAIAAVISIALPACVKAQSGRRADDAAQAAVIEEIEALARARRLAVVGSRTGSAESLVEAARILIDVRPRRTSRTVVAEPDERMAGPGKGDAGASPLILLEAARSLAGEDYDLLDEIERLESRARPVRVRGAPPAPSPSGTAEPWQSEGRVKGQDHQEWRMVFEEGEEAIIRLIGDGDTNLDLYVVDEGGNVLASDEGATDQGLVRWVPTATGEVRVVVNNLGSSPNEYWLITNAG